MNFSIPLLATRAYVYSYVPHLRIIPTSAKAPELQEGLARAGAHERRETFISTGSRAAIEFSACEMYLRTSNYIFPPCGHDTSNREPGVRSARSYRREVLIMEKIRANFSRMNQIDDWSSLLQSLSLSFSFSLYR